MALWTPYAEQALDLTKTNVKEERTSPTLGADSPPYGVTAADASPPYAYGYPPYPVSPVHEMPPAYPGYYQQHPAYTVPVAQISPDSVSSSWSSTNLYPKTMPAALSPPETPETYEIDTLEDDVEYQAFERDALRAMAEKNGGTLLGNNPRMRRAVQTSQAADDSYRKQRERNNFAAKQSRDRRKLREVRLAFQVTYLKKKLADLKARLSERVCVRCHQQCMC